MKKEEEENDIMGIVAIVVFVFGAYTYFNASNDMDKSLSQLESGMPATGPIAEAYERAYAAQPDLSEVKQDEYYKGVRVRPEDEIADMACPFDSQVVYKGICLDYQKVLKLEEMDRKK